MAAPDAELEIENLTKSYGEEVAVEDLSMTVEPGTLKSLLGPSGCGKTTTLRCIAGLEKPDSGRIYVGGELVSAPDENVHIPPEDRDIGMVFQSYAVWPHMTVEENVRYPLKVQGIGSRDEQHERVSELLDRVELAPYRDNLATNLSGGQQQRVAIARALIDDPNVLLFDEPLSNLDAKLRRDMRIQIKELYHEFNTTVLYVTHSQDEAMFLSDEIALMLDGGIIEEGHPVDLHTNPQTFFGMNFMGQCNTYRGTVESVVDGEATVNTRIGHVGVTADGSTFTEGDQVFVCFRPKACRIVTGEEPLQDGEITFAGRVIMDAATRDFFEYQIDVDDATLLIRSLDPHQIAEGDTIRVAVDPADVNLFEEAEGRRIVQQGQVATGDGDAESASAGVAQQQDD